MRKTSDVNQKDLSLRYVPWIKDSKGMNEDMPLNVLTDRDKDDVPADVADDDDDEPPLRSMKLT